MPSLNFKKQFAPLVIAGTKPHTIRALRVRPFKPGDTLSFFSGPRFAPWRIRKNTPCTAAVAISIFTNRRVVIAPGSRFHPVPAGYACMALSAKQIESLAKRDGFASTADFFAFFLPRIPKGDREFRGQLIEWAP